MNLNARQLRLLLIIGTEDFNLLNEPFKKRIAPAALLEQLLDLSLIACSDVKQIQTTVSAPVVNNKIKTSLSSQRPTTLAEKFVEPITTTALRLSTSSITDSIRELTAPQNGIEVMVEALGF